VVAIGVPTLLLSAFRGGASPRAVAVGWRGGKLAHRTARGGALVSSARQRQAVERLIRIGLPVYCAGPTGNYVALTFDDGPSELTPQVQQLLRGAGARATFFIVGANMTSPTLAAFARGDARLGAVADHTWSHARLTDLPEEGIVAEIVRAKKAILAATHAPVLVFRPPYAAHNSTVDRVSLQYGMLPILWNTDSKDWAGDGWHQIADNVSAGLQPGSIILMHDSQSRAETIKALRASILPELKLRGLRAVTLPELFALDPPSVAQLKDDAARGACSRGQHDGT
jgi:peptidoglycan/xylan/chitin deacetylase (PgdA/CDA1 family)